MQSIKSILNKQIPRFLELFNLESKIVGFRKMVLFAVLIICMDYIFNFAWNFLLNTFGQFFYDNILKIKFNFDTSSYVDNSAIEFFANPWIAIYSSVIAAPFFEELEYRLFLSKKKILLVLGSIYFSFGVVSIKLAYN